MPAGLRYLSLFSGLEAAHLAWAPLGWTCVAVAEIEPAPCAVLAHRLPDAPNLGDVTAITDGVIAALGPIDVVIGGSPCQDLSVAGRRAGLDGTKSSLFFEQLRIFHAARTLCGARWLVWENVPGVFTSHGRADFGRVVGAMAGCDVAVPEMGWGTEGVALGAHGLAEWSVLDAQWFGVAQRRRRVFVVLDTGDWTAREPVLLEPDRLRGDSPPRRTTGTDLADGIGAGIADDRQRVCGNGHSPRLMAAMATGQGGAEITNGAWAPTLTCDREPPLVAHALSASYDASEDGTGRGVPLALLPFDTTQLTSPGCRANPKPGDICHTLAAGADPPAIAFGWQDSDPMRTMLSRVAPALRVGGQVAVHAVANALNHQEGVTGQDGADSCIVVGSSIRRLTPRECERLQGVPDDWTLVPRRKGLMADGPRYRMLGNSFAVPVIRWIGQRIAAAHNVIQSAA
jgi:DNA (cytosine-5)-methyltransferase 1